MNLSASHTHHLTLPYSTIQPAIHPYAAVLAYAAVQQILSISLQPVPHASMTIAYHLTICLFADITPQVHDFQTPPIMYLKQTLKPPTMTAQFFPVAREQ